MIFVSLASLGVTTAGFIQPKYVSVNKFSLFLKSYIHLYNRYHCICAGQDHRTRLCCEEIGGLDTGDQCSATTGSVFIRCCRKQGVIGACTDPLEIWR